jgi:nucleoid-associated protein YgaU
MRKKQAVFLFLLSFAASGCVVRTYKLTRERVDQDLISGNRGYLMGKAARIEEKERKKTRTTQVVEVELYPFIKFEKAPKEKEKVVAPEEPGAGNRGYITESIAPQIAAPESVTAQSFEKYTVQKNDTLQKISKNFYGTTRKWKKIFEANKDMLKSPDKVYPGQVLNIPLEEPKEDIESLK